MYGSGGRKTIAFVLSGPGRRQVAAILLGGYSGVSFQAGAGARFRHHRASSSVACVLGGGRRHRHLGAMLGALTFETLCSPS